MGKNWSIIRSCLLGPPSVSMSPRYCDTAHTNTLYSQYMYQVLCCWQCTIYQMKPSMPSLVYPLPCGVRLYLFFYTTSNKMSVVICSNLSSSPLSSSPVPLSHMSLPLKDSLKNCRACSFLYKNTPMTTPIRKRPYLIYLWSISARSFHHREIWRRVRVQ